MHWKEALLVGCQAILFIVCAGIAWRIPRGRLAAAALLLAEAVGASLYLGGLIPDPAARRVTALLCVAALLYLAWLAAGESHAMRAADHETSAVLGRIHTRVERTLNALTAQTVPVDATAGLPPREVPDDWDELFSTLDMSGRHVSNLLWIGLACLSVTALLLLLRFTR
ncbi:MAG: hypothetical protein ACK47B_24735 [Armatimonadota bacterium]